MAETNSLFCNTYFLIEFTSGHLLGLHSYASLNKERIAGNVFGIIACKEYTDLSNILLGITVASQRDGIQILFKHFRIFLSPLSQFISHNQRQNHIDIDIIGSPLIRSYTGETANSFFRCSIGTLPWFSGNTCTRCKVNNRTFRFF